MVADDVADAAQLASLADETPEGRSVVVLAKERHGIRARTFGEHEATFVPFTAETRMSGINYAGREIRKGAAGSFVCVSLFSGNTRMSQNSQRNGQPRETSITAP